MTRIRIVALAAIAIFAVSITAVATASAADTLVNKEGKELVKKGFTGTGGKGTLEVSKGDGAIVCSATKVTGQVTGLSTGEATVTFTGCEFASLVKCNSSGAKSGEIVTALNTKLVLELLPKEKVEPALLLSPKSTVVLECTSLQKLEVSGSILLLLGPNEKLTKTLTLTGIQSEGKQASTESEETPGGTITKNVLTTTGKGLKNFTAVESGEETEATITFEEEVELKG